MICSKERVYLNFASCAVVALRTVEAITFFFVTESMLLYVRFHAMMRVDSVPHFSSHAG